MSQIMRIGMDTSKSVFQLHGVDATERPVLRAPRQEATLDEPFLRLDGGRAPCVAQRCRLPTPA